MSRVKTQLIFDPEFKEFLEYQREITGTSLSRIVEIATKKQYQKEYEQFLKSKEKENKA